MYNLIINLLIIYITENQYVKNAMEVKFVNMIEKNHNVKIAQEVLYVNIVNVKPIVKYVTANLYVNHLGVKLMEIKNMKVIVYLVL